MDLNNVANLATLKIIRGILNTNFTKIGNAISFLNANNYTSLQAAADDGYAKKMPVYVPAGTWLTRAVAGNNILACLFLKPGAILFGDGDATLIKRDPADPTSVGYMITYDKDLHNAAPLAERNYTLLNLKVQGLSGVGYEVLGSPSEDDGGIFLATATQPSNRVILDGVTVINCNKELAAVWGVGTCIFRGCTLENGNHDGFNPQACGSLIMQFNYVNNVNFAVEYDGRPNVPGATSYANISDNHFIDVNEFGIVVESGNVIKVHNNLISAKLKDVSLSGQGIGIFISPRYMDIDTLDISGNTILNFTTSGIDNSVVSSSDYAINSLHIKQNTIKNTGGNAIKLTPYDTTKFKRIIIEGNTLEAWNRITANGNAFLWSAIRLEKTDGAIIKNNEFRGLTGGLRNDPLYIKNTVNTRFYGNDCAGPVSASYATIEVRQLDVGQSNTNTGFKEWDNVNVYAAVMGTPVEYVVRIGDETTALTTGVRKYTFRFPYPIALKEVRLSLSTASTAGNPTFDIKKAGVSIFAVGFLLSADANELTSLTAATQSKLSNFSAGITTALNIPDDTEMTVDVTIAGTGATGAKITFIGYK